MPVPQELQVNFKQKELTLSLRTNQYEVARSKANFLEHKILTELFPMHDALQTVTVDKTIRKFLLSSLALYDTFAEKQTYHFGPPNSLFELKHLINELKSQKAKNDLQAKFDRTITMFGTVEQLADKGKTPYEILQQRLK